MFLAELPEGWLAEIKYKLEHNAKITLADDT